MKTRAAKAEAAMVRRRRCLRGIENFFGRSGFLEESRCGRRGTLSGSVGEDSIPTCCAAWFRGKLAPRKPEEPVIQRR